MTSLVRRFLKTAIVFLFAGLLLGLALSAALELEVFQAPYPMRVAHTHLILVGFVMMMIMGVALWMFPRPGPEDARYKPERMDLVWWLMTGSVSVRTAAELATGWWGGAALRVAIFAASIVEIVGIALFFGNLWTRIRSPREAYEKGRSAGGAPRA
jgi:heme/copper-type cytochrome/quinol oxidase subunit 1